MKIYVAAKDDSAKEKARAWIKNRITDAKDIWNNNKKEIIIMLPIIIGGVKVATKTVGKQIALNKMEKIKDCRVYDNVLGHYWELNRKLDNDEWLEIKHRKNSGEDLGDILRSMGVLR